MRKFSFITSFVCFALTPFIFLSCGDPVDDEEGDGGGGEKIPAGTIMGVAQKGQFLRGSSITIYSMDKELNSTGLSYPTQTTDDMGSFSVSSVDAAYIDVKANGYYYNENKGSTSESTINLQAVAKAGSKVNVNLLTTLAYNRIKYLVRTGLSFSDAQNRAQIEVLTALGLGNSAPANFIDMNIAGSGDANGLLLAASLLIQQDRSVGDVSKLISDLAADLEEDGLISSDLNLQIHRNERNIYIEYVVSMLLDFYRKNKVEGFSVPTFYNFLDTDGDGKMDGQAGVLFKSLGVDEVIAVEPTMIVNPGYSAEGFSRTEEKLITVPFEVKSDAEWLSVKKRTIAENIYAMDIVAQANTSENRTAHVEYIDNSGKILKTYTYQQKAPDSRVPQRLYWYYAQDMERYLTDKVGVNGKVYNVSSFSGGSGYYGGYWYVDIPSADKQDKYQLYFPTNMVSVPEGYGSFKLTIPTSLTTDDLPFIGQLENGEYSPIGNPNQIPLRIASPVIYIYEEIRSYDHLVITSEQPICGSASYGFTANGGVDGNSVQIIEQETHPDADGQYRITVQINHNDKYYYTFIPVLQANVPVKIECYDSSNQIVRTMSDYSDYFSNGNITR